MKNKERLRKLCDELNNLEKDIIPLGAVVVDGWKFRFRLEDGRCHIDAWNPRLYSIGGSATFTIKGGLESHVTGCYEEHISVVEAMLHEWLEGDEE